ncbi:DUF3300 domain-containing protein [Paraburkholderia silvatlantica]|uniref:DUF3300 domain-containing protein n=1 Tax=Paraburkholderia silvatlantica TaxID=321895 RepID=A0ABR6FWB3_9BURK|nr:DUF3300 domain-containing protein [Paraburkholderia silvatlantica]MBB2931719.1 hypothetical protein [Paraburkholderia silvatlantica]PVY26367.1 uncharacterized protein DUF3300 [Paraburkholderia silvatlantica]PXW32118.1 uncharacterized protein DUF3300 [Paraburkholderia silvatlantica]TDQ82698.1 uncharacterized protein DUF3300 [Paraburkholderia silvatlantica]
MKTSGASQRLAWLVCATLAGAPLFVGPPGPAAALAQNAAHLSNQQLDSLTAPIALYPDALLAQVLMAATFPQDVAAAAAWARSNPNLKGDDAVKAVASQPWDPSVQSLVAFPQVLETMASKPDWVQQIGNAFLAQPNDVMDSVQRLRVQAQKAGNLKSNEQQKVVVQPASSTSATQTIVIEPANPQVVYVPTYNPTVVYGAWPYPAYPPVYMPPPPGYAIASGFVGGLAFGAGIAVANSLWGGFNWNNHDVNINVNRYNNINVNNRINSANGTANWNRNANVERRQNYSNANLNGQRGQYRGYDQSRTQAMETLQNRTGQNMSGNAQQRLQGIQEGGRPNAGGGNELNNRAQSMNRDNALRGAGDGANARLEQQRGQQSRDAFQSHGGFNGGAGGGGFHGGGGGFGGGGRHFGRR